MKKKINPAHPGKVLKNQFMVPYGLSNYKLAKAMDISETHIGRIVNGKTGITADIAMRLQIIFGMSAKTWLNMQTTYDLLVLEAKGASKIAKSVKRLELVEAVV
jgi:antitoxin HigA-1